MSKLQLHVKDKSGKLKNTGCLEIKNQTSTSVDFNILGDIVSDEWSKWCDEDTCPTDVSDFLKSLDNVEEINVHINSGGGSVYAGIAIYNMIKRNSASVTVYVDGIAASIASVIACAGDRVVIPSNATFMIHKPSNGYFFTSMNADDLRKDADTLDICQKTILNTYMTKTKDGVTAEKINEMINAETWLVGSDVAEYFDFEVEEANQAAACSSDFFDKYKNTPDNLKKLEEEPENVVDIDSVANRVLELLEQRDAAKIEAEKQDLLKGLDRYGK